MSQPALLSKSAKPSITKPLKLLHGYVQSKAAIVNARIPYNYDTVRTAIRLVAVVGKFSSDQRSRMSYFIYAIFLCSVRTHSVIIELNNSG